MNIKLRQVKEVAVAIATLLVAQSVAIAETPVMNLKSAQPTQAASYIVLIEHEHTRVVPVPVKTALLPMSSANAVLTAAFGQLMNTSRFAREYSAIPTNTKLLSLRVQSNDVYVDLSREFLGGGGSASMINRLTQVVYTATSLNPNSPVYISVEGKPLDENNPLAGEGLMVRYPISRQQLAADFPLH
jgi:spore germination protein GerM